MYVYGARCVSWKGGLDDTSLVQRGSISRFHSFGFLDSPFLDPQYPKHLQNEVPGFPNPLIRGLLTPNATEHCRKLEHGCRLTYADVHSFFGFGLEDGHVPTFWLLLQNTRSLGSMDVEVQGSLEGPKNPKYLTTGYLGFLYSESQCGFWVDT